MPPRRTRRRRTLRERVEAVPGVAIGDSGGAVAESGLAVDGVAVSAQGSRASISGFGYSSRVGADVNGPGYRTSGGGATISLDRVFAPGLLGGIALSYSAGKSSALGANSDADTVSGAIYGAWVPYPGWEIEGLLGVDGSEIDTRRVLTFGTTPVVTRGDTHSFGVSAAGNIGYRFRFGAAYVKPFAGLAYASQDRDGIHRGRPARCRPRVPLQDL